MKKTFVMFLALTATTQAADWKRIWKKSAIFLVTSSSIDIGSSLGKRELNPILAGHNGRFGSRGVTIKLGLLAGNLTAQHLILRNNPEKHKQLAIINLCTAGAYTGIAARNFSVK